jgi:hypothetical protein
MTRSNQDLENRLRGALHGAARQLAVPEPAWTGPSPKRGRRTGGLSGRTVLPAAGVLVALVIAALAVALLGQRHATPRSAPAHYNPLSPPPAAATDPHLTRAESRLIGSAWMTAVKHDSACHGFSGAEWTTAAPSRELSGSFGVLRGDATPAARVRNLLRVGQRVWGGGAQLLANQIHAARTLRGGTFYVIPARNISAERGVPARCQREQRTALQRALRGKPARLRAHVLAAQARYLAYLRFEAVHPEGLCADLAGTGRGAQGGTNTFVCATLTSFGRWGVLADASSYLDGKPLFWTVVPDGVATVTLKFTPNGTPAPRTVIKTLRPVNNVVYTSVPHGTSPPHNVWTNAFPSQIILRAADGRVLRRVAVTPNMPTLCGFSC